jgi:mono/diheme cytochrome c family protein
MLELRITAPIVALIALVEALNGTHHPGERYGAAGRYYTTEQARAGAKVFAAHCIACHGSGLEGVASKGPPIVGPAMRARRWRIGRLYDFISHQMPANARGSLSARAYVAVAAFLLEQNGHPPGRVLLTPARISKVTQRF